MRGSTQWALIPTQTLDSHQPNALHLRRTISAAGVSYKIETLKLSQNLLNYFVLCAADKPEMIPSADYKDYTKHVNDQNHSKK